MNILTYLNSLRPAMPMSMQQPKDGPHAQPSNSELRRWINDGSVIVNGERWKHEEEMPPLVYSVVYFPKSQKKRCTII